MGKNVKYEVSAVNSKGEGPKTAALSVLVANVPAACATLTVANAATDLGQT